ncbi:MAG TPA: hypothetical protein VK167_05380 [Flavipsychrobacter sp.]|nr:hypothetical protein [Flavipsychrobacter sp.]
MLYLWADKLELLFNDYVLFVESLKIVIVTIASLIAMRIAVVYFRKRNITNSHTKIVIVSILTILISAYLYISYAINIADHNFLNRKFRTQIAQKITYTYMSRKATNLSYKEYAFITDMTWFPKIDNHTTNISFSYEYDDFLPDYSFSLSYYIPKGAVVTMPTYTQRDLSKHQTIDTLGNKLKVHYQEIMM